MSEPIPMTKCENCSDWFEPRMINGAAYLMPGVTIDSNHESCPHCGKMTTISKHTVKLIHPKK